VREDGAPDCSEACYRTGGGTGSDYALPVEPCRSAEPFTCLYLTERGRQRAERMPFDRLERAAGAEVSLGAGDWINVYTLDEWRVRRVAMLIGFAEVIEVSTGDDGDES
jgi:hypothetical protein